MGDFESSWHTASGAFSTRLAAVSGIGVLLVAVLVGGYSRSVDGVRQATDDLERASTVQSFVSQYVPTPENRPNLPDMTNLWDASSPFSWARVYFAQLPTQTGWVSAALAKVHPFAQRFSVGATPDEVFLGDCHAPAARLIENDRVPIPDIKDRIIQANNNLAAIAAVFASHGLANVAAEDLTIFQIDELIWAYDWIRAHQLDNHLGAANYAAPTPWQCDDLAITYLMDVADWKTDGLATSPDWRKRDGLTAEMVFALDSSSPLMSRLLAARPNGAAAIRQEANERVRGELAAYLKEPGIKLTSSLPELRLSLAAALYPLLVLVVYLWGTAQLLVLRRNTDSISDKTRREWQHRFSDVVALPAPARVGGRPYEVAVSIGYWSIPLLMVFLAQLLAAAPDGYFSIPWMEGQKSYVVSELAGSLGIPQPNYAAIGQNYGWTRSLAIVGFGVLVAMLLLVRARANVRLRWAEREAMRLES